MTFPNRLNRDGLVDLLVKNVRESGKTRVVIQTGHFPLRYDSATDALREDLDIWGVFSRYTFAVGCAVASRLRKDSITSHLLILADDHKYQDEYETQRAEHKANGLSGAQWAALRKRFWRANNGHDARIAAPFEAILNARGVRYSDILRQQQRKSGREATLYHSEMILRAQGDVPVGECSLQDPSKCRAEYSVVLREFTNAETAIVSLVPMRCYEGVNDALQFGTNNANDVIVPHLAKLAHTHVFLPSESDTTRSHLESGTRADTFVDTHNCVLIDSTQQERTIQYLLAKK